MWRLRLGRIDPVAPVMAASAAVAPVMAASVSPLPPAIAPGSVLCGWLACVERWEHAACVDERRKMLLGDELLVLRQASQAWQTRLRIAQCTTIRGDGSIILRQALRDWRARLHGAGIPWRVVWPLRSWRPRRGIHDHPPVQEAGQLSSIGLTSLLLLGCLIITMFIMVASKVFWRKTLPGVVASACGG